MRYLLPLLAGLVCWSTVAAAQLAWQTVTMPEARFAIDMPGAPVVTEPDASPLGERSKRYLVDLGPTAYYAAYTIYRKLPDGVTPGGLFDKSREILVESVAGSLRAEAPLRLPGDAEGGEGRELVIDGKDGTVYKVHLYVRGARIYRAMVAGPKGFETSDGAQRFFASFHFIGP